MKKVFISIFLLMTFACTGFAQTVVFNVKTHKYHSVSCKWAKKCTVNCIKIEKQQAKSKGGIPCKVCGGG